MAKTPAPRKHPNRWQIKIQDADGKPLRVCCSRVARASEPVSMGPSLPPSVSSGLEVSMHLRILTLCCSLPLVFMFAWSAGCYVVETPPAPVVDDDDFAAADDDAADDDDSGDDDDDDPTPPLQADDAAIVSAVLPTELDCTEAFQASVEVQNTGTATWTRDAEYKLGAADDEDPLFDGGVRIYMPEGVTVPPGGSYVFPFELVAPSTGGTYLTDWQMVHEAVTWFGETASSSVTVACSIQTFVDPLTSGAVQAGFADKSVSGGTFSAAGWQTTGGSDQILLELVAPIWSAGTLEIDVTNFDPATQYSGTKHQIVNMYTSADGSQGVFTTTEAWWNIRTGSNYGTGLKFLAAPQGGDTREEVRLIETASWSPSDLHTWTVTWDAVQVELSLDGVPLTTLAFANRIEPLQHIFLGKDNVYGGQVGPIYSNLRVTYQP